MSAPVFIAERMAQLATTHANHIALIDRDSPTTFSQLQQQVGQLAGNFAKLGIKAHDRVAIWLPNCIEWVQSFLACTHLGATVLAVNTRFRSKEVADIIERGKADWLIMWPDFKGIAFADILADVDQSVLKRLKGVVTLGDQDSQAIAAIAKRGLTVHLYDEQLNMPCPAPKPFGNAGALCFTTSGTTSLPKFVLHDHVSLLTHADGMKVAYEYDGNSRILAGTPFCGAFGFCTLSGGLLTGATVVCEPVSDTESTLSMIERYSITNAYINNESLLKLFEAAKSPSVFKSCKLFGFAVFSPAISTLLDEAKRNNVELTGLYGSSEVQALVGAQPTHPSQGDISVRYLAGGRVIHPDGRVRARDPETGRILPHGESGEIEIKSPSRMVGYLDNPQATAKAITDDGYFKTGDLGYTVSDRQFVFQTRMGDSFRLSGFLVNPAEIEQVVETFPGVKACQVVGATVGTKILPVAFVILQPGATADTATWTAECKRRMAGFKVPVRFETLEEFPSVVGANGVKIQKNKMREMAEQLLADSK